MLHFYEFTLPFQTVFKTGTGDFLQRSGILIHFRDSSDEILAEASPLPGFSAESLADVKNACDTYHRDIETFLLSDFTVNQFRSFLNTLPDLPSLQFALSYLGLQVLSQRKKIPFHLLLERPLNRKLQVNDVIGAGTTESICKQIKKSIKQGFRTIKIKVPDPSVQLANCLNDLHKSHPEIRYRLDANQKWPLQKLEEWSSLFEHPPVEYVEEPVSLHQLTELPEILARCKLPVALDESVSSLPNLTTVLNHHPQLMFIIKPSFFGNLFDLVETISRFRTLLNRIVITTSIESRVGRSMVAAVAAVIGSPETSHGLNTGCLFKYDLLDDFIISEGVLELPKSGAWYYSINDVNLNLINRYL